MGARLRRVVVAVALGFACAACDASVHASGHVRDEAGGAVPGALVALESIAGRTVVRADSAGAYEITQLHGGGHGPAEVRACKAGFSTERRAFVDDDSIPRPLDITLHRRASPAPPSDSVGRPLGPCV